MRNPRVFYLMQGAYSALFRASDRALREQVGLSTSQQAVLFALLSQDGLAMSDIADKLNLGRSSLTGLIDRMSAKGLVRRRQSGADARSYTIHIEDAGRQLAEATLQGTRKINNALLEPFSADERRTIEKFLTHVARNADAIVTRATIRDANEEATA